MDKLEDNISVHMAINSDVLTKIMQLPETTKKKGALVIVSETAVVELQCKTTAVNLPMTITVVLPLPVVIWSSTV